MSLSYKINPGDIFSTPFEKGCICLEIPDIWGNFLAKDSDGIVCQFNTVMIEEIKSPEKE